MKKIKEGTVQSLSEKEFRNFLGGNLGCGDLGDWMECAKKHGDDGKSVSQLFDEYNQWKIDNGK